MGGTKCNCMKSGLNWAQHVQCLTFRSTVCPAADVSLWLKSDHEALWDHEQTRTPSWVAQTCWPCTSHEKILTWTNRHQLLNSPESEFTPSDVMTQQHWSEHIVDQAVRNLTAVWRSLQNELIDRGLQTDPVIHGCLQSGCTSESWINTSAALPAQVAETLMIRIADLRPGSGATQIGSGTGKVSIHTVFRHLLMYREKGM